MSRTSSFPERYTTKDPVNKRCFYNTWSVVLDGHEKTVTVVFDQQAVTLLVWSKKIRCFIKAAVGDTFIYQLWKPIYASQRQKKSCRKKNRSCILL